MQETDVYAVHVYEHACGGALGVTAVWETESQSNNYHQSHPRDAN